MIRIEPDWNVKEIRYSKKGTAFCIRIEPDWNVKASVYMQGFRG